MKLATFADSKAGMIVTIGVVGAIAAYYTTKKAKEVAVEVGNGLNPNSKDNIINQGVNAVGETLTGDKHFTLGGWLYYLINGTPEEQAARREEQSMIERLGG